MMMRRRGEVVTCIFFLSLTTKLLCLWCSVDNHENEVTLGEGARLPPNVGLGKKKKTKNSSFSFFLHHIGLTTLRKRAGCACSPSVFRFFHRPS